jgi:hypothetical protein
MPSDEQPEWLTVGNRVAVTKGRTMGPDSVTFHTVDRLTARDVVLDNGARFGRKRLEMYGENGGTWSYTSRLKSADDPDVIRAVNEQRRLNLVARCRRLLDDASESVRNGDVDSALKAAHAAIADLEGLR